MAQNADYQSRFLPYLTTAEVTSLPKEQAVVVLPVASIEQHGPHLPIYTDSIIVQEVLSRTLALLPGDFPVWILPLLPYGRSNEHAGFAARSPVSILPSKGQMIDKRCEAWYSLNQCY